MQVLYFLLIVFSKIAALEEILIKCGGCQKRQQFKTFK